MCTSPYRFFSIVKTLEETCKSPENNPLQKNQKNLRKPERNPQKNPEHKPCRTRNMAVSPVFRLLFTGLISGLEGFYGFWSAYAAQYAENQKS